MDEGMDYRFLNEAIKDAVGVFCYWGQGGCSYCSHRAAIEIDLYGGGGHVYLCPRHAKGTKDPRILSRLQQWERETLRSVSDLQKDLLRAQFRLCELKAAGIYCDVGEYADIREEQDEIIGLIKNLRRRIEERGA